MATKKPLYIFLHIPKCAGSTVKDHITNNLKKDEFLLVYDDEPPYLYIKNVEKYIESLRKEQKDKIKVIIGPNVYYGIHKLFPGRKTKYITFLRNPIDRIISQYNFRVGMIMFDREIISEKHFRNLTNQHMKNGKMLSFKEWFLLNDNYHSENFIFYFLFIHFSPFFQNIQIKSIGQHIKPNGINLEQIKKILDKFYFIGITEQPEDFLFLYYELGINKFFPNANISKKYFVPEDYEEIKKFVLSKNKYDKEIYNYALKLNKKFKTEHKDFYQKAKKTEIKRKNKVSRNKILSLIYKLSAELKKRSRLYAKFVDLIQNHI